MTAWSIPCGACFPKPWPCLKKNWTARQPLPAAIQILKSCGLATGLGRPTGPTTVEEVEQAQVKREIDRTLTALTPEDVRLAEERRQSDRTFAALTAFP